MDCNGEVLGPVTAQDFVDALQYVLTPAYASSTASLVTPYVAGAEDYYNYLFYKASAENGTVAEDGTTYTLEADGSVTAAAADGTTTPTDGFLVPYLFHNESNGITPEAYRQTAGIYSVTK